MYFAVASRYQAFVFYYQTHTYNNSYQKPSHRDQQTQSQNQLQCGALVVWILRISYFGKCLSSCVNHMAKLSRVNAPAWCETATWVWTKVNNVATPRPTWHTQDNIRNQPTGICITNLWSHHVSTRKHACTTLTVTEIEVLTFTF